MKRMNLLPPELRPRETGRRGSAYVLVGVLTAAVFGLIAYGVVIGGVHSDESELVSLKAEAASAQARAEALSPYGEFADMKDRRERSVRTVAQLRFNYERLTRELTRILPAGVWVSHLEVAPAPPSEEAVAAGADSPTGAQATPPAMKVSGCAPSQTVVADTLDRLHALTGATNVTLGSSSHDASNAAAAGSDRPYLVSGPGSNDGCGGARPRVSFDATVTLTSPGGERVPTTQSSTTTATTTASTTGAGS